EFPRALGNPGEGRKCRMRIIPVNREPNLACVRLGHSRARFQEISGESYPLDISGNCISSSLVLPPHETDRCASRIVDVKRIGHMDEGHSKMHRYQFNIGLILINDNPI